MAEMKFTSALIDGPSPFATLETWEQHLKRLKALPDNHLLKTEMIKTAQEMITKKKKADHITGIRIHPSGQGRSTDECLASHMERATPRSYRKAQDVLVAAKKYVAGPAFFRSRKHLIQTLQTEIYKLKDALLEEDYKPELKYSSTELLFSFLSEFSDAYPNWQKEYAALNGFIPRCV